MMPGISVISSARCGEGFCHPSGVEIVGVAFNQYSGTAEGATGAAPSVIATFEERPTCHSCDIMCPPLACTASTILFQPPTCSSVYIPGAPYHPRPAIEIEVASEMMRPPSEVRCS